jgi:hypothetical protein
VVCWLIKDVKYLHSWRRLNVALKSACSLASRQVRPNELPYALWLINTASVVFRRRYKPEQWHSLFIFNSFLLGFWAVEEKGNSRKKRPILLTSSSATVFIDLSPYSKLLIFSPCPLFLLYKRETTVAFIILRASRSQQIRTLFRHE